METSNQDMIRWLNRQLDDLSIAEISRDVQKYRFVTAVDEIIALLSKHHRLVVYGKIATAVHEMNHDEFVKRNVYQAVADLIVQPSHKVRWDNLMSFLHDGSRHMFPSFEGFLA